MIIAQYSKRHEICVHPGQQDAESCTDDLEITALTSGVASGKLYRGNLRGRLETFMNLMAAKRKATTSSSALYQESISSTSAKFNQDIAVCTAASGSEPGPSKV